MIIDTDGAAESPADDAPQASTPAPTASHKKESVAPQAAADEVDEEEMDRSRSLATPAVRRIAIENNVNLKLVKGSGKEVCTPLCCTTGHF